jgi:glycosyltransferase involved in cell wall biosynthesis
MDTISSKPSVKQPVQKQDTRPLVSIITPAYNEAEILQKNLDILYDYMTNLDDQYRWELVVINDASTDETGQLLNQFAEEHPKVKPFHHRVNRNLSGALQTSHPLICLPLRCGAGKVRRYGVYGTYRGISDRLAGNPGCLLENIIPFFFLDEKEASALGGQDCIQILTPFQIPNAKMNKLATLRQYSFFNAFETEIANLNKVGVHFGLMQIWLTVLAEGFSLAGRLCFAFEVLLCLHMSARKASNPKVSQRAMPK